MPLSIASFESLKRVSFAIAGLWLGGAPAAAGLSSSVRTVQPIDYVATEVRSERDYDLQAYWKDQIGLLEWNSPRGVALAGASPARAPHSCAVTGYTFRSANARLSFVDLTMANR